MPQSVASRQALLLVLATRYQELESIGPVVPPPVPPSAGFHTKVATAPDGRVYAIDRAKRPVRKTALIARLSPSPA
ncbi:hypothetical protein TUSST3_30480 [Streptomyces sp. TUS-ST3]|nr:hypothetical protein TUSST3_30480 [Streptomyces sp. TUS-ST3]